MNLAGRTALVTGGSRGFGRTTVKALMDQGMRVIAVARSAHPLRQLEQDVSGVETRVADVTDPIMAARLLQQETPHVLVLNAGANPLYKPISQHSWETFSLHWKVDVKGVFLWAREALLKPLEPGSHIFVMSSGAALAGSPMSGGYAPAKAALWQLSDTLTFEAKPLGIRVTCLFPNLTPTTELGKSATSFYSSLQNVDEATFVERIGSRTFSAEVLAESVVSLLRHEREERHFRVMAQGLEPLAHPPNLKNSETS